MAHVGQLAYHNRFQSRGRWFSYYRRGKFKARLAGEPGTPAFQAAYVAAHTRYEELQGRKPVTPSSGSLAALLAAYRSSPEWRALGAATRKDYEKGLGFLAGSKAAAHPASAIERKHVRALRDQAALASPSRANKVVTMLSILLAYSIELGWRADNPALRFPKLRTGGPGYRAWSDDEVSRFQGWADAEAAAGRPFWRRAFALALYTGQRGQDQVAMTRASYDGSAVRLVQLKTGTPVWVPAHRALKIELDRDKGLLLLAQDNGTAWPLNKFQKAAGQAIRAAGLGGRGCVWHGLRATAATKLAELGCSEREIMAVTGHTTPQMVQRYTRDVDRKRLATAAIKRLEGTG